MTEGRCAPDLHGTVPIRPDCCIWESCVSRSHPDRLDSSAPSKSPPPRPKKVDRLCGCLPKERRLPTPYPYRGCRSFNRKAQATAAVEWIVEIDCDLKQPLPVGHTDPCLRDLAQTRIQPLRRHIPPRLPN